MKTRTKLALIPETSNDYAAITISAGDESDFDGNLVLRQDDDTIVVPASETVEFAKALLAWAEENFNG